MQIRQGCFCALKVFEILSFLHSRLIKYTFIREGKFDIFYLLKQTTDRNRHVTINIKSYFTYETEATDGGQQHPLQPEAGVADGHQDRRGVGSLVGNCHILNRVLTDC